MLELDNKILTYRPSSAPSSLYLAWLLITICKTLAFTSYASKVSYKYVSTADFEKTANIINLYVRLFDAC